MPRIRSKQVVGETPLKPEDITTKQYVDELFNSISGGTPVPESTLTVEDENNIILSGVNFLNFRGIDVTAMKGSGSNRVDVWIPSPSYAPFFNEGTANVDDFITTDRYVSSPTSEGDPFKIGDWNGGDVHSTIRNNVNPLYQTNGEFSVYDLTTTFTANIYDADGVTLLAQHSLVLDGDLVVISNGITLDVNGWTTDSDRYKTNIAVTFDMATILPNGGRFSIELVHDNSVNGIFTYTHNDIFKDAELVNSAINGTLQVTEGTSVVTKLISGVYFYTMNSEWEVNINGLDYLNSTTYPLSSQLIITDTNLFIASDVNAHGENFDFSNWTNIHNNTNASYNLLNWTTDEPNNTNWNHATGFINDTYATGVIYDWVDADTELSVNYNYLLDTFQDISDRNTEVFRDENGTYPRLESDLLTPWDNSLSLVTADGGNGLQIIGDRLVYPQYDFTVYAPYSVSQPDYSSLSGDKVYYRRFETNGTFASTGLIRFGNPHNITENDIQTGNIIIELSIDNGASWNTMQGQYVGGSILPNDSIRTYVNEYNLDSGTIESNSMSFALPAGSVFIHMRVTYTDTAKDKYISLISIDNNSIDGGTQW